MADTVTVRRSFKPGEILVEVVSVGLYGLTAAEVPIAPIAGLEASTVQGALEGINGLSQNKDIYVSPAGNDTSGDGSEARPYKTIQKAVNSAPKNIGAYTMSIRISAGIYNEDISVTAFYGQGKFYITGQVSSPETVRINGIVTVKNCRCIVKISGCKIISTAITGGSINDGAIRSANNSELMIDSVIIDGNNKMSSGISAIEIGNVSITICNIFNCAKAINMNTNSGTRGLATVNIYNTTISNCNTGILAAAAIVGVYSGSNGATTKYQKSATGMIFVDGAWV